MTEITPEDAQHIQYIVYELKDLDFFFMGSRQMLENHNYYNLTDWDWAGQSGVDWGAGASGAKYEYLKEGFVVDKGPMHEVEQTPKFKLYDNHPPDADFRGVLRHKTYPHITVIIRHELELYKRMWNRLEFDFWYHNLWKSNPNSYYHLDPYLWKSTTRQLFNKLMEQERNRLDIEDWM